ncbi:hypothetical protein [Daejeonella oryzae]|uniref:hypothetical protein n=1 Tax=Daejeonella oryzae TaxID=1122943 RepID=UPI0003FD733F|nr:hypothetical protein [Daejeonella oryzae]
MARQKGIIKLKGTIGDISFYKSKDGYLAREKGGVDATRIASDPAFVRTRENGAEFGRAGSAGKLLRNALRNVIKNASDPRVTSRLTQALVKVVQADLVSVRGLRNVLDGELELLTGFEFNVNGKLGSTLFVPYTATIDRVTGEAVLSIPAYVPLNSIGSPVGTTHFKLNMAVTEIDFESGEFKTESGSSNEIVNDANAVAASSITLNIGPNSTKPLFVAFGIEFFQEVNGLMYSLKNGAYNGLALVKISGI